MRGGVTSDQPQGPPKASGGLVPSLDLFLSLSHVPLLHQISPSRLVWWSFLLFLSLSVCFSLLLLSAARAFTYTKRNVCTLRREDNGALDHALVLLSREFDVTTCCMNDLGDVCKKSNFFAIYIDILLTRQ